MLSAHLLGMLGGLLIIAVGVVHPHLHLTGTAEKIMVASVNMGNWINVFGSLYSAITGAQSMFRHLSKEPRPAVKSSEIHDHLASAFDLSAGILIFMGLALVSWGFCCEKKTKESKDSNKERKPVARTARSTSRSATPRKKNL